MLAGGRDARTEGVPIPFVAARGWGSRNFLRLDPGVARENFAPVDSTS